MSTNKAQSYAAPITNAELLEQPFLVFKKGNNYIKLDNLQDIYEHSYSDWELVDPRKIVFITLGDYHEHFVNGLKLTKDDILLMDSRKQAIELLGYNWAYEYPLTKVLNSKFTSYFARVVNLSSYN